MRKFETSADAFKFYDGMPASILEARAQAIRADIAGNADADLEAYRVELAGVTAAQEQRAEEPQRVEQRGALQVMATDQRETRSEEDVLATPEYRSAFYKQLLGRQLEGREREVMGSEAVQKRAAAFNSSSNTAAVLPTSTLNEVIVKARDMGGILGEMRSFKMPSGIAIPVATPGANAAWHEEGATVEPDVLEPTTVRFDAHEILRVLSISAKVQVMSIPAFESYLSEELAASVRGTLEESVVTGTGEGQALGIIPGVEWSEANTVAYKGALTYGDIIAALAKLKRGYSAGAKLACNQATLFTQLYGLVDDNARPLFVPDPTEAGKGRVLGVVDDYVPDGTILYGAFRFAGWNLPDGIALERSTDSGFRQGVIDFRALAIADARPIVSEAFVRVVPGA